MNGAAAQQTQLDHLVARPSLFAEKLLSAMEASEGRRRKRARNTTPDAIGMGVKRDLLHRAMMEDPEPDAFEGWLYAQVLAAGTGNGATRAMALDIQGEWRLVASLPSFRDWLAHGTPSADAGE